MAHQVSFETDHFIDAYFIDMLKYFFNKRIFQDIFQVIGKISYNNSSL